MCVVEKRSRFAFASVVFFSMGGLEEGMSEWTVEKMSLPDTQIQNFV
jgi:hypothetical protein